MKLNPSPAMPSMQCLKPFGGRLVVGLWVGCQFINCKCACEFISRFSWRRRRGEDAECMADGMEVVVAQEEQDNGSVEFNWGFVFIKTKAIISCSVRWGNHRMNEYLEQLTIIFNSTSSPNILGPWIDGRIESAINQLSGGLSIIIHH